MTTAPLAKHALFSGLQPRELELVRSLMKEERFPSGHEIVKEGEPGDRLYFICEGSVEILKTSPGADGPTEIAVFGAGDTFGEMELIEAQGRSASVRVYEQVTALSLSSADLHRLFQDDTRLYAILVTNLARQVIHRLRRLNVLVASSVFASGG
jgi:CRP-like cAMP-binding protein